MVASTGWLSWNFMAHPLLGEDDSSTPPRWLSTAARIAVQEEAKKLPGTRISHRGLGDDPKKPSGIDELYLRR